MRRSALILFAAIFIFSAGIFPVKAQTSSTSALPTVRTQGIIGDFFNWLAGVLAEKKVPEKVEHTNCSTLPLGTTEGCEQTQVRAQGLFDNILSRTGQDYGTVADTRLPYSEDNRSEFQKWIDVNFAVPTGTEKAKQYCGAGMPLGVCSELLASADNYTSNTSEAMANSDQAVRCANLPLGSDPECDKSKIATYVSPTPTATPTITPTPPEIIISPPVGPSDGSSVASCPVGNGNCPDIPQQEAGTARDPNKYKNNACYWKNFLSAFPGNEVKARAASQICLKESGGNLINLNDHCLPYKPDPNDPTKTVFRPISERTRDYSVGLFQVNLLAHCPGALRDDWNLNRSCTVVNQQKLDECYARLITFDGNVAQMKRISNNGTNWRPWSTAAPAYCGITAEQMMCVPPVVQPPPDTPPSGNYVQYLEEGQSYSRTVFGGGNQATCDASGVGCNNRIGNCGCGLITLASILSTYVSTSFTPTTVNNLYYKYHSGCFSGFTNIIDALSANGMKSTPIAGSTGVATPQMIADWRNYIRAGNKLFTAAYVSYRNPVTGRSGNNVGHFFWITDIDDTGRIYVMDGWRGPQSPAPIYMWDPRTYTTQVTYQRVYAFTPPKR